MKSWIKGGLIGVIAGWALFYLLVIRLTVPRINPELSSIIFISLLCFAVGALISWLIGKKK
jgi:hypothetical protein